MSVSDALPLYIATVKSFATYKEWALQLSDADFADFKQNQSARLAFLGGFCNADLEWAFDWFSLDTRGTIYRNTIIEAAGDDPIKRINAFGFFSMFIKQ